LSYLTHRRQLTVEWGHCDPAGIVFNSRFFEYFDHSTWLLFERALALTGRVFGSKWPNSKRSNESLIPAQNQRWRRA
jgi:hypothetical protein